MAIVKAKTPATNHLVIVAKASSVSWENGEYRLKIKSIAHEDAPNSGYEDKTPQLRVEFADEKGKKITKWYNLVGYETNADGTAMVDGETGRRIISESKTATCMEILGNLAIAAGAEEGAEVTIDDLKDSEVGALVQNKVNSKGNSYAEIARVFSVDSLA